jgi:hypothetical protein
MDATKEAGMVNIFVGLFFIALSVPLVKRKIKMNKWYGVRIPRAFKSEESWYKINEYGGRVFIYWSIPILLSGILLFFSPSLGKKWVVILEQAPLVFVVLAGIQTLIYSRKF